jgi:hypothetical protein
VLLTAVHAVLAVAPVIFVTLDGVARADFLDPANFQKLRAHKGTEVDDFEVSTPALISLPAYQSIFVGKLTPCESNDCSPVSEETFLDRVASAKQWKPEQLAVFASWDRIERAVAKTPALIHADIGRHQGDAAPPWEHARFDADTWKSARRYVTQTHPRFLYLSLDDADEWAHRGDRAQYLAALKRYDGWLTELSDLEKDAVIVVTTDHGRGAGAMWTDHGPAHPRAREIWLWARGLPSNTSLHNHLDLRPLFERLFGS